MPSDQSRTTEQAKFISCSLGKSFEKQIKTVGDQRVKDIEALKTLIPEENREDITSIEGIFPKEIRTNVIKNEADDINKWEEKIKGKRLKY